MVAEVVGVGEDVEGGVLQFLDSVGVVVHLQILRDELGVEDGAVEVLQQILRLRGQGADGGAHAVHRGRGHGGGRNPNRETEEQEGRREGGGGGSWNSKQGGRDERNCET